MDPKAGSRLEYIMTNLGLDQMALSKLAQVDRSTVSRWLAAEKISKTMLRKMHILQQKYNVNTQWIESGKGEPFRTESTTVHQSSEEALLTLKNRIAELEQENKQLRQAQMESARLLGQLGAQSLEMVDKYNELLSKYQQLLKQQATT